jgi:disulfide bond formation protein DsbB
LLLFPKRSLPYGAAAASLLPLLVAQGAERLLGMPPCAFCLLERRPYWVALALAALAAVLPRSAARAALWGAAASLLVAAALSFVHVGVEQHWWPDPLAACSAPDFTGMTMAQRLAAMPARPAKPCEDPDFLIPGLPMSMAQMGVLYALAVCAGLAMSLARGREGRHELAG